MKWERGEYSINTDPTKLDNEKIFTLLSNSYWASDRPKDIMEESLENSLNFGVYQQDTLVGFGRVITDKVVFSWLLDVVIEESHRGEGLGKWLVETIINHPDVKQTSIGLSTKDAHSLYERFGFEHQSFMRKPRL
ncbi:GNAT family N-acetyltransferase [Radiobacillus kanasensis]|uniref:GNAT family N-acetyltransferase n=1 Tax=Radiobacillus kanasensis TaxID=2844358 RepID=UPI001E481C7B|nr:GNAT family N-acetyltransferase [Radiobacillus kanasensis]UFU00473.1 GNAT family N-acetyltransferase [Radiobacillus kanasensis]